MVGASKPAGVPDCSAANDGCQTFYYTNQQCARLMFYHDHAWGITRLNVYAGEAAGYLITDPTEQKLIAAGTILVRLGEASRWSSRTAPSFRTPRNWPSRTRPGTPPAGAAEGNLWYHHVYMPAQNPGDPSGMSAFGRWMYGPWFWPPATPRTGRSPTRTTTRTASWTIRPPGSTRPTRSASPQLIPGTPNISVGMEQFNDTPIVNGTAYPTTTVDPKSYRLRILNAANDRFWNLQWYVADPTTGTDSEVALKAGRARGRPDRPERRSRRRTPRISPAGPDWIQIGTEGGFLPAPVGRRRTSRSPGSPTRPASTSATSTSTRCCWLRPSGPT